MSNGGIRCPYCGYAEHTATESPLLKPAVIGAIMGFAGMYNGEGFTRFIGFIIFIVSCYVIKMFFSASRAYKGSYRCKSCGKEFDVHDFSELKSDTNDSSESDSSRENYIYSDGFACEEIGTNEIKIAGYNGKNGYLKVPSKINGKIVTEIGDGAFALCESIENVKLPDSIKRIEYRAFGDCENLQEINIPKNLKKIPKYCFHNCKNLKKVEIPLPLDHKLEEIQEAAFADCENLTEIYLNKNLKKIQKNAFFDCKSLRHMFLPRGVEELGEAAFAGCENLEEIGCESVPGIVEMPTNLKKIPANCFMMCKKLSEIKLPEKLEEIGDGAFGGCESLDIEDVKSQIQQILSKK